MSSFTQDPSSSDGAWSELLMLAGDHGDPRGVSVIRVHGVGGGTTPEIQLGCTAATLVAGNRIAGFYRAAGRPLPAHLRLPPMNPKSEATTSPPHSPSNQPPNPGDTAPQPDPCDVPLHDEVYSWGGLTSRSRLRALWILLLPYLLANLAGWASPARQGTRGAPARQDAHQPIRRIDLWAARWAALALTLSITMTLSVLTIDMLGYQCGSLSSCRGHTWLAPDWSALDTPARRVGAWSLVLAGGVALSWALSRQTRRRYEQVAPMRTPGLPTQPEGVSAAELPGGLRHPHFWAGDMAHRRLTESHLAAAGALIAICLGAALWGMPGGDAALRWVALAGIAVASLVAIGTTVLVAADPHGEWSRWALGTAGLVLLGEVGLAWLYPLTVIPDPPGHSPGVVTVHNTTWLAIGLLLVPLAIRGMRRTTQPSSGAPGPHDGLFRHLPGFAYVGTGFFLAQTALLSLTIRIWGALSGKDHIQLVPSVVPATTLAITAGLGLVLLFAVGIGVGRWRAGRRGVGEAIADCADETARLQAARATPTTAAQRWVTSALIDADSTPPSWAKRLARSRFLARVPATVHLLIVGIALVATLIGGIALVWSFGATGCPPRLYQWGSTGGLVDVMTAIAVALPQLVVLLMVAAWRTPSTRRIIGVLWDVGSFWPRAFHPLAPPCYAERAVPELLRRVSWLNDNGGEVVLAAHSQGSILAAAAALRADLRLPGEDRPRFHLVTYGSPIRKLYGQAFPAWVTPAMVTDIGAGTGLVPAHGWINVYYETDYIGGRGNLLAVDRRLPDPQTSLYTLAEPPPRVRSHTGYSSDPRLTDLIRQSALDLAQRQP